MRKSSTLRQSRSSPSSDRTRPVQRTNPHDGLFLQTPWKIFTSALQKPGPPLRVGIRPRVGGRKKCPRGSSSRAVQTNTKPQWHCHNQHKLAQTCSKVFGVLLGSALLRSSVFSRPDRKTRPRTGFLDHQSRYASFNCYQYSGSLYCRR